MKGVAFGDDFFTPQTPAGLPTLEAYERGNKQQRFRIKSGMTE
jgi:hypothetical protein